MRATMRESNGSFADGSTIEISTVEDPSRLGGRRELKPKLLPKPL